MPRTGSKYDDAFLRQFTVYWTEGLSTAQIGRRLGVSKNVICGLRKRQKLAERGSPLKPKIAAENGVQPAGPPKPRRPRSVTPLAHARWLPWFNRLPAHARRLCASAVHAAGCPAQEGGMWLCQCGATQPGSPLLQRPAAPSAVVKPAPTVAALALVVDEPAFAVDAPPSPPGRRVYDRCAFPKGTPGKPGFRSCDAPIYTPRTIYCPACHGNAYVPVRAAAS